MRAGLIQHDTDGTTTGDVMETTEQIDPKALVRGTFMRHEDGGIIRLDKRKADDTGWWGTDGSGLADFVIVDGGWEVVEDPMDDPNECFGTFVVDVQEALADAEGYEAVVIDCTGLEPCASLNVGGGIWLDVTVTARRVDA